MPVSHSLNERSEPGSTSILARFMLTRHQRHGQHVRCSMMRLVGFLGATLTLASCADTGQSGGATLSTLVSPTFTVGAQISPQRLPIANAVTIGCPLVPTTNFDLIVLPSPFARVSVETVTLRLIDGTSVGGPMLTFPRARLNRMFGSTLVVARRVFTFQ